MSALKTRLLQGLESLNNGDLDAARNRLDEVAFLPGEAEPIPGLAPETEAKFFELLGGIALEQEDTNLAEEAFERHRELDPEGWAEYGWDADAWDDLDDVPADDASTDAAHDDCTCHDLAVQTTDLIPAELEDESDDAYFENIHTGSFVDIERQSTRLTTSELQTSAHAPAEIIDSITTIERETTSIVFEADDDLPDTIKDAVGWDVPDAHERNWDECHVEEVRILRTTLVYREDKPAPYIDVSPTNALTTSACPCSEP